MHSLTQDFDIAPRTAEPEEAKSFDSPASGTFIRTAVRQFDDEGSSMETTCQSFTVHSEIPFKAHRRWVSSDLNKWKLAIKLKHGNLLGAGQSRQCGESAPAMSLTVSIGRTSWGTASSIACSGLDLWVWTFPVLFCRFYPHVSSVGQDPSPCVSFFFWFVSHGYKVCPPFFVLLFCLDSFRCLHFWCLTSAFTLNLTLCFSTCLPASACLAFVTVTGKMDGNPDGPLHALQPCGWQRQRGGLCSLSPAGALET